MLVWMALTHLPTAASIVSSEPIGYATAAQGFIFLSGLFCGLIYFRLAMRRGYRAMTARLWKRAVRLYGYVVLLLAMAFLVVAPIAAGGGMPGLHNLLDFFYTAGPQRAVPDALALIYQPPLLDILPMYVIFMLATPLALILARRVGWAPLLAVSFAIWVGAQFDLRDAAHAFLVAQTPLRIPRHEMGSFDLYGWQFLWLAALYLGVRWAADDLPIVSWARRLAMPALAIAIALFVARFVIGDGTGLWAASVDKWHLGVVRLVDFVAISLLLVRYQAFFIRFASRPLILLGQASLQVYCVHLLFCFAGLGLMGESPRLMAFWPQVILIAATLTAMLITATVFARKTPSQVLMPPAQRRPGMPALQRSER
jgi:hypothetical protein